MEEEVAQEGVMRVAVNAVSNVWVLNYRPALTHDVTQLDISSEFMHVMNL